uniref:Uncharacterized protein n=1 Tax=Arundo donax TaxID=35708 RepID=A0A0A8YV85_ARUDO
MNHPNHKSTIQ